MNIKGNKNASGQKCLVLKPDIRMFFIEHAFSLVLILVTVLMTGYDEPIVTWAAMAVCFMTIVFMMGRYWYWVTVRWEINMTQIKSIKGVMNRSVDYVELYRVIDYFENQNLFQQLCGIKDVYIMSNDRTHPVMRIYGIPYSTDLIEILKPLVNKARKENHIYEIANR